MMLRLKNMSVQRAGRQLISGLDCALHHGEIIVVLGPNGAGKSSLLLALAGLIPLTGELELCGKPLSSYARSELTEKIAWQGELPPTEFGLTVQQRLELSMMHGTASIEQAVASMDIGDLLNRALGELSSGERQRVELVALMLRTTPIWLLDEPTAHLDLKHQVECVKMLKAERSKGRAIMTVLHDMQQAMAIADQLILVDGYGHAEYGAAKQLCNRNHLSRLFEVALMEQGDILTPDYRGELNDEITRS
ncbi:MAG: ABC transporter ATP-binding protein [Mariprofundus sp.]|nr:ABC transporter ATP-binding protein [Mariprofundus sp.]